MVSVVQAYLLAYTVAAGTMGGVAVYVWRHRTDSTTTWLFLLLLAGAQWAGSAALALFFQSTPLALVWAKTMFLGMSVVVPATYLFVLEYTGRERSVSRRTTALLGIEPIVFNAVLWLRTDWIYTTGDPGAMTPSGYGVAFNAGFGLHILYLYALLGLTSVILLRFVLTSRLLYRRQTVALLSTIVAPTAASGLYFLGFVPLPLAPITFAFNGAVYAWLIFRADLLDLTPIAREQIIDTIESAVLVVDANGRIVDSNAAAHELLGHSDLIGDHLESVVSEIHPLATAVERLGGTAQVRRDSFAMDDSHYQIEATTLRNQREEAAGTIYLIHDVTERHRREQRLERQNERLDRFASTVSHDLRNPLNIAYGHLDLARDSGEDTHLDQVEEALDHMDGLIDDVLALAHGDEATEMVAVELETVVRNAWESVSTGDATVTVDTEALIRADESSIQRLFENLFRNALEHAVPGADLPQDDTAQVAGTESQTDAPDRVADASALTVTVGDSTHGFFVADNGPGIPPEKRDSIFEFGYTSGGGTGLGLAIVDHVVSVHGWEVQATASDTGGARFEFHGVESAADPTHEAEG
jgi:PAS domain S-box-containing protein